MLLDGATGTNLIKLGMSSGDCTEQWVLEHPAAITDLQRAYVDAGSDVITAPTFEANRFKLKNHGLEKKVAEINRRLVALSRAAADGRAAVAGNMAPTGIFVEPFGDESFDGLCDIFREQAFALKDAGVDYIACETFMSLTEARAALLAAKETGLPVTVTLTVNDNGKTLSGGDLSACFITLAAMGANAVGLNCSTGPEIVLRSLAGVAKHLCVPLIAKPNAGVPGESLSDSVSPNEFASYVPKFFEEGAGILGGCCGTTPDHIAQMRKAFDFAALNAARTADACESVAACEKQAFFISKEHLNFSDKIRCGSNLSDDLLDLEGENCAARVVISNEDDAYEFGMNAYLAQVPVVMLGCDAAALDKALRLYQGRAMIDSKSDLPKAELSLLAARYGAIIL
jgi:5-methyltetrahydrofolate--homocysteine methyltransferase